jgi:hypothetical protein
MNDGLYVLSVVYCAESGKQYTEERRQPSCLPGVPGALMRRGMRVMRGKALYPEYDAVLAVSVALYPVIARGAKRPPTTATRDWRRS